jgi:TolB-like protein
MIRSLSFATRLLTAAAVLALPALAAAQDTRPVVVVYTFTNSSIGAGASDFNGIATGVQDLLITDLASNAKIRLVDRSRIADVLQEQNMVKANQIDPQTAVRLGKIMGAQYAIIGGFLSDGRGKAVLTGRTIDIETTQIGNPQKIEGKADDVLGMIGELSSKLASNMTLTAKPGRRVGDASGAMGGAAQSGKPAGAAAQATASNVEQFAKPVSAKAMKVKLDGATLKLYSNALDEIDRKNTAKAKQLLQQVLAKYQDFEPARNQLDKIS